MKLKRRLTRHCTVGSITVTVQRVNLWRGQAMWDVACVKCAVTSWRWWHAITIAFASIGKRYCKKETDNHGTSAHKSIANTIKNTHIPPRPFYHPPRFPSTDYSTENNGLIFCGLLSAHWSKQCRSLQPQYLMFQLKNKPYTYLYCSTKSLHLLGMKLDFFALMNHVNSKSALTNTRSSRSGKNYQIFYFSK